MHVMWFYASRGPPMALLNWLRKAGDVERRLCLPQPTDVPGLPSTTVKAANDCVTLQEGPTTRADRKQKERVSNTCTVPWND